MRKLLTGELCAGEPLAQFGGRGGRESFPTPINTNFNAPRSYPLSTHESHGAESGIQILW